MSSEEKGPTRDEALALLNEYVSDEKLLIHALTVEGVMRYMARKQGEDEDKWGIVGLIHDIDYEQYPEQHCQHIREILVPHGWPEEYIRAAESHGWGICSEVKPESPMENTLFAVDELTGLVYATALVRPSKSVLDMKAKSVKKKWKSKNFAAGADRDVIQKGADMLGVELSELFTDCIMGMREVAEEIGLGAK